MRHLGKARTLAAEQTAHAGATLRLAAAECVNPFPLFPLGSRFRRRGPRYGFGRSRFFPACAACSANRGFLGFFHRLTGDFERDLTMGFRSLEPRPSLTGFAREDIKVFVRHALVAGTHIASLWCPTPLCRPITTFRREASQYKTLWTAPATAAGVTSRLWDSARIGNLGNGRSNLARKNAVRMALAVGRRGALRRRGQKAHRAGSQRP